MRAALYAHKHGVRRGGNKQRVMPAPCAAALSADLPRQAGTGWCATAAEQHRTSALAAWAGVGAGTMLQPETLPPGNQRKLSTGDVRRVCHAWRLFRHAGWLIWAGHDGGHDGGV